MLLVASGCHSSTRSLKLMARHVAGLAVADKKKVSSGGLKWQNLHTAFRENRSV